MIEYFKNATPKIVTKDMLESDIYRKYHGYQENDKLYFVVVSEPTQMYVQVVCDRTLDEDCKNLEFVRFNDDTQTLPVFKKIL
jgi:hypothetical protein